MSSKEIVEDLEQIVDDYYSNVDEQERRSNGLPPFDEKEQKFNQEW